MRRTLASLILLVLTIGCSSLDALVATPTQPAPTPTATLPPSSTPTASPFPTATSTLEPSPIPEAIAILVSGSDVFVTQTNAALDLLQQCAPEAIATADQFLDAIQESDRSGMEVETDTFLASLTTAFAPDYSLPAQVFWYAGSIIHDARHSWQHDSGTTTNWSTLTLGEREAIEADARGVQIAALELCVDFVEASARTDVEWMLQYLVDMQTGAIPCDYCQVEWADRDW